MGNVSDSGYEDAVKAKATFANYRARAIAMQKEFSDLQLEHAYELQSELETFDKIWSAVTADKIGAWDYPAQVVRHVKHMRDDLETVRSAFARAEAENGRLTDRGSLIAWAIETAKVWVEFLNTTDVDSPPTEALCDTLNVLIDKVNDYKREALAATSATGSEVAE